MFFNELDLLELRLMELYDHVDYFVLVEGNKTHVRNDKEFIFEKNKGRFAPWIDKIIHIKVEDFPPDVPNNEQFLENYHRNQISRGLAGIAEPGDRIMVSDVDEIPNMEIVKQHLDYPGWFHFKCNLFYYYVNNQLAIGFGGVVMSPYELMVSPQRMRMMAIRKNAWSDSRGCENVIVNTGWHYSYLCGGDAERVKFKASNILEGHRTEEAVGSVEAVAEKIKNHQDLYNRRSSRYKQAVVDISNNKPKSLDRWLSKHPEYYYQVVQDKGLFTHSRGFSVRGINLCLHEHEQLSNHIRRENDFFEANILDYIKEKYPVQKTIVDAGANIGNHTSYFANFLKYASIVCFEPIPDNFRLLEENSNYPNIKLYQSALSNKQETLKMSPNHRNMGASRVNRNGVVDVEAVALDSLNLQDVSLLKIDVEDSEVYVLEGAKETIRRCHPRILLEDKDGKYGKLLTGYVLEKAWPDQCTYLYSWNPEYETFKVRGIELIMFTKDQLSDVIHRNNDFIEFDILDYLKEKYPVQKTIVDAGANIGNHTVYFANFLKYDSIHSFEPMPEVFKLLEINANYPNVKLYEKALRDKHENLRMKFERKNTGGSRVKSTGNTEVEAITIDSLNLQDVTLLKIDVENSEGCVINGAKETIDRCHPLILVEDYKNGRWGIPLIEAGYILEKVWPDKWTYLYRWTGKPYLIELYTRTPGCANYERTFPIVSDSVRHLPIVLRTYRGHLHRWDHMPMTLGDNMCIFTDSADVIFQKPFPTLDPKLIYVSNEGKTFQENSVWRSLIRRYPQFEPMLPEIIYNVGSFACSGKLMKSWCEYLFSVRGKCRQNSIEQLWFNVWLRLPENRPLITEIPGLFAALYGNVEMGTAILKDNQFVTPEGIPYTAVHFNGNLKDIYHSVLYNET